MGAKAESDLANGSRTTTSRSSTITTIRQPFILDLRPFASPQALVARHGEGGEAHDVLRMKGSSRSKASRADHGQGVGARIQHQFDRKWPSDAPRRVRLVRDRETGFDKDAIRAMISELFSLAV